MAFICFMEPTSCWSAPARYFDNFSTSSYQRYSKFFTIVSSSSLEFNNFLRSAGKYIEGILTQIQGYLLGYVKIEATRDYLDDISFESYSDFGDLQVSTSSPRLLVHVRFPA